MKQKALYMEIADEVIADIAAGRFQAGDRLYSRRKMAEKYNIGEVTAVNVQNYLAEQNFVKKIKGRGVFINNASSSLAMRLQNPRREPVKKIIELRFKQSNANDFPGNFFQAADRLIANTARVPVEVHWYSPLDVEISGMDGLPVDLEAGYLMFYMGSMSSLFGAKILLNSAVHSVVVDTIFPDTNSVLTDSFDGMGKLVQYAADSGCEKFIYAKNFIRSTGTLYNEERELGMSYHVAQLKLQAETFDSGSYAELVEYVNAQKVKTAVMFPQDEGAIVLSRMLGANRQKHIICGFDDYSSFEKAEFPIPTIRPDFDKIIAAAFEILCGSPSVHKRIIRVPGTLVNV